MLYVYWISVPIPSLCFLWDCLSPVCPLFPCLFLRRHSRMSCVLLLFFVFLFVRHCFQLSPQQCLTFYHSFDFRSFILSDSSLPNPFMICLAFFYFLFYFYLILYLRSINHHVLHRPGHQHRVPHSPSLRSLCPHLCLLRLRLRLYLRLMAMAIRTLWAMHTLLDMDTHTDMPIRICMAGTPLWHLNLPLRVLMELESVVISGSALSGSTFASISRVDSSHLGRSCCNKVGWFEITISLFIYMGFRISSVFLFQFSSFSPLPKNQLI